jgi:hypothetical protein
MNPRQPLGPNPAKAEFDRAQSAEDRTAADFKPLTNGEIAKLAAKVFRRVNELDKPRDFGEPNRR